MTAHRPVISPGLLASLLEAAPAQVLRQLEAEPGLAAGWVWTAGDDSWQVAASEQTVRLTGAELTEAEQLTCTCPLSPRCAHVLAVAQQLELSVSVTSSEYSSQQSIHPTGISKSAEYSSQQSSAPVALSPRQRRSAEAAWQAGAGLLASGAHGGDGLRLAEVLRAAHGARRAKLPRLATAATRVATQLRARSGDDPGFGLSRYAHDLAELLLLAHRLEHAEQADPELVGVARRAYTPIASRRLYGICTESVHTASGYAGVVTHLADADGGLWSVSNVAPIPGGYREAAGLGGLSAGHHELGRLCVAAQGLSASADGRLSLGGGSTAVRGPASDWTLDPLASLWDRPLAEQLDRLDPTHRAGLVFVTATVLGLCDNGLALGVDDGVLLATVPVDNARWVANLRRIAGFPGMTLRLVCRADPGRPPYVTPLACAQTEQLRMPARWAGRVNLGLDQLPGRANPVLVPNPPTDANDSDGDDPLAGLRRMLHRVVLGGRSVVAGSRTPAREAAALRSRQLGTAADLLEELAAAARETRSTPLDEQVATPPDRFARGWLAAMTYDRTVRTHLAKARWPVGRTRHE